MTTTVVKTIGSTGDFATPQLWYNSLSGLNLPVADQIQQGQCQNQEFTAAGLVLNCAAVSVISDATRYVELTTAAGASFRDNAGVRTNPAYYDATKGAGLRNTGASGAVVSTANVDFRMSNLQLKGDAGSSAALLLSNSATTVRLDNCILVGPNVIEIDNVTTGTFNNVIAVITANLARAVAIVAGTTITFNFCDIIVPAGVTVTNSVDYFSAAVTVNWNGCALFGASTALAANSGSATITYNHTATDLGVPAGTGNLGSLTYANQFVSTTNDFRAKSGAGLTNAGVPISGITVDISNFARNGSTPTIGAWELAGAGGNAGHIGSIMMGFGLGLAAAKKMSENPIITRRGLLLPHRRLLLPRR